MFHASHICNFGLDALIEAHQEIDRSDGSRRHLRQECRQFRPRRLGFEIRTQILKGRGVVGKRILFRVLEKKIKRVKHRHLGNQIHFHE